MDFIQKWGAIFTQKLIIVSNIGQFKKKSELGHSSMEKTTLVKKPQGLVFLSLRALKIEHSFFLLLIDNQK